MNRQPRTRFLGDRCFWFAASAGPVAWTGLSVIGLPFAESPAGLETWLLVVLIYPVLEEFLFRGVLQGALLRHSILRASMAGLPLSLANLLTSAVFAAAHLLYQSPLWAALVFLPSLVLGWMRERYGSIIAPTVLHIVYNAGFVALFVSG